MSGTSSRPEHVPAQISLGAVLSDVRAHGMLASHREHLGGGKLGWHEHGAAYVCVVFAGGYEQAARDEISCRRGSLVAHPDGHVHANRFGPSQTRCVDLHFDAEWTEDGELRDLLVDYRHFQLDHRSEVLARLERELLTRDAGTPLVVAGVVLELLGHVRRRDLPYGSPRWISLVKEAIAADISCTPGLNELSALAGVHPAHLARAFRAAMGESVGTFARRLRLEAADDMLARRDITVAEVAAATGFYDQAHFARSFRRRFGLSPSARRTQRLS